MGDYVREPATDGRVLLETTVGPLEIELWSRECPLAARNFIQHALDGYYDDCQFFRCLKGQLALTGDPSNTGDGGVSIYPDNPYFQVERHARLRFRQRGLVGMTRLDPQGTAMDGQNGSQFFITFNRCEALNGHSTLFGKLSPETLWNALRIDELALDDDDRPLVPPRILRANVINDPFNCKRSTPLPETNLELDSEEPHKEKPKPLIRQEISTNRSLLSFAEEVDEECDLQLPLKPVHTLKKAAIVSEPQQVADAVAEAKEPEVSEGPKKIIASGPYARVIERSDGLRTKLRRARAQT